VRSELNKRGTRCTPLCPRCESRIETLDEHAFMTCPYVTRTWFGSPLNLKITEQQIPDFKDWITYSIINLPVEVIIQMASIIYNIWQARNQNIYDRKFVPEEEIIQRSSRCISDFLQANTPSLDLNMQHSVKPYQHTSTRQYHWHPRKLELSRLIAMRTFKSPVGGVYGQFFVMKMV